MRNKRGLFHMKQIPLRITVVFQNPEFFLTLFHEDKKRLGEISASDFWEQMESRRCNLLYIFGQKYNGLE